MTLNNPIELPSLEEIEEMDERRRRGYESLEISTDDGTVKCQNCGIKVPLIERRSVDKTTHADARISVLRHRILTAERYHNNNKNSNAILQLKEELSELLKREQERETQRKIPLYSSKITNYLWFCSSCYDQVAISAIKDKKNSNSNS